MPSDMTTWTCFRAVIIVGCLSVGMGLARHSAPAVYAAEDSVQEAEQQQELTKEEEELEEAARKAVEAAAKTLRQFQPTEEEKLAAEKRAAAELAARKDFLAMPLPEGLINIGRKYNVWIDKKHRRVIFDGDICLRKGALELFACELGMKSHESVVQVHAQPSVVHAALLAVGAQTGKPVRFRPEYRPATGDVIDIVVKWLDKEGNPQQVRAQDWVRDAETGKAMKHSWVFPGSSFWKDELTKKTFYLGDSSGDFICVSNFPTATLDLPVKSSDQNDFRMYEAFTERIPPLGTKVRLILTPRRTPKAKPTAKPKAPAGDGKIAPATPER